MNFNSTGRNLPPIWMGEIKWVLLQVLFIYIQNLDLYLHFEVKVEGSLCTAFCVDCASDRASVISGAGIFSPGPHSPFPPPL